MVKTFWSSSTFFNCLVPLFKCDLIVSKVKMLSPITIPFIFQLGCSRDDRFADQVFQDTVSRIFQRNSVNLENRG
jgi:hypothetical protein